MEANRKSFKNRLKYKRRIEFLILLTLMLFSVITNGCALLRTTIPTKYDTYSSLDNNLLQKSEEDMIVISHYPKQVLYFSVPTAELRIVIIKDGQPQVIRLIDPATGKAITGSNPQWSPDGKTIGFIYVSLHVGLLGRITFQRQPAIVRYDGTGLTLVPTSFPKKSYYSYMRWSADGSKLFIFVPTSHRGSMVFGTATPHNYELDIYDYNSKKLESSVAIKEHAKIKDCFPPVISPSGVRLAHTDQEEHLYLVELETQKEIDLTSQIRNLVNGTNTLRINDLDWVNDEQLLIAMGNVLISFDCKALIGRILLSSSSEKIVRVKYLIPQKKLLVGYARGEGVEFNLGDVLFTPLILLPLGIPGTKYMDTAFALVDLDGCLLRPLCIVRDYTYTRREDVESAAAWIYNTSSKGRYVTIHGIAGGDEGTHVLDLETDNVYRAVGY